MKPQLMSKVGQYQLIEIIGHGSFSIVYKAVHLISESIVAMKLLPKSLNTQMFLKEVEVCKMLDHPLIAQVFDSFEDENYFYLVMEYVPGETLLEYINSTGKLDEDTIHSFAAQLLSILDYLHNKVKILHRDLKTENIIVNQNKLLKLIDFGFSKPFTDNTPSKSTLCGSLLYTAPEILYGDPYSTPADIWGFGVILYSMAEGRLPYNAKSNFELVQEIENKRLRFKSLISILFRDLVTSMLQTNQTKRITINQMKSHQWFVINNSNAITEYFQSPVLKVMNDETIDCATLDAIQKLGVSYDGILDDLRAKEFNQKTTVYRIIRKEKINAKLISDNESGGNKILLVPRQSSTIHLEQAIQNDSAVNSSLMPTIRYTRRKCKQEQSNNLGGIRASSTFDLRTRVFAKSVKITTPLLQLSKL